MAKQKFDGVVEAVHYEPDGQIKWVRGFEKIGFVFSDRVLIEREALIEKLKSGKKFVVGKRIPYMGNNFEISTPVRLISTNGQEVLVTEDQKAERDYLEGVPVF
jgi:hypothetical protein